ncbi:MAG: ferrochelatase [Acidimicrobiales bacterium]
MRTTGVLVMAYGTPATRGDVAAYYLRIRHGRAPRPEQLADLVRRYDAIGGTSPLAARTADQVYALSGALERYAPGDYDVRFGAKYAAPLIEESAAALVAAGVTRVVGLPLAPHSSSLSTDEYHQRAGAALGPDVDYVAIGAWWDAPGFAELIAQRVTTALEVVPPDRRATSEVVFSAHSLPQRILERGDTYPDQLRVSAEQAARHAGLRHFDVAWQSAGRTEEAWLGPDILQVLRDKRAAGFTDVVICPIGFVADHLEVLYDIDVEAQDLARSLGLNLVRTASLNDDPALIEILVQLVAGA